MDIITIQTPQFKDGKIDRMHIQKGTIIRDGIGVLFTPLNDTNGDHPVWFHCYEDYEKALTIKPTK